MSEKIYMDYNASAPLRPEALALMQDVLTESGNASSVHSFGRKARSRIERAREQISALIGTQPNQLVFTSGATESNNTVLSAFRGQRILVSAIEHPSVLESAPAAEKIPVTQDGLQEGLQEGLIDEQAFINLLEKGEPPALISIMLVNNETGAIQPVEKLARLAKKRHPAIFIHTDAVQAAGRIKIDMPALQVDYLSLSAHKMGGPQGVGALITAPGSKPVKLLYGGGQEKRQRAGTENVAGIAGFGMAADIAQHDIENFQKLALLRDKMEENLSAITPHLRVFSKDAPRIANTSAIGLSGLSAETLIMALDLAGIAVSSGAACSSGTVKPSHVLQAMGACDDETMGAFRISIGWDTKECHIDRLIEECSKIFERTTTTAEKTDHA